jgi:hypothetical protein
MRNILLGAIATLLSTGATMAQEKIVISSPWGKVTAELVDNAATRALLEMLPVTLEMQDHLRRERREPCLLRYRKPNARWSSETVRSGCGHRPIS